MTFKFNQMQIPAYTPKIVETNIQIEITIGYLLYILYVHK